MKSLIATSTAFMISVWIPGDAVIAGQACESTSLTPDAIESCLNKEKQKKDQKSRETATFPSGLSGKAFNAEAREYRTMTWRSDDGQSLIYETTLPCTLVCSGGNIFVKRVDKDRVITFTQGIAGEGNTADDAIVGTAIAAAIIPILAPFQAMATVRSTRTFSYTITYLSDDGEEITDNLLAESLVPEHDWFYTFLPTFTGLDAGERRSAALMRPFYQQAIDLLDGRVKRDEGILFEQNARKPWCIVSNQSKYPLIQSRYQKNISRLNEIEKKLGMSISEGPSGSPQNLMWENHLNKNPNLRIWAEFNAQAADKFKSCSSA